MDAAGPEPYPGANQRSGCCENAELFGWFCLICARFQTNYCAVRPLKWGIVVGHFENRNHSTLARTDRFQPAAQAS
jgi:hypothetical protein